MKLTKFEEIDSTNRYLKEKEKKENYEVVVAERQSAGRGRRGNKWGSPKGAALFSFVLEKEKDLKEEEYQKLPLVVGAALLKGMKKVEDLDYKFKWTNDLYLDGGKLGGILVEKVDNYYIIGIGININNTTYSEAAKNGISLKGKLGKNYNIDDIIRKVVTEFKIYWSLYLRGGWSEILFEINENNFLLGKKIVVENYRDRLEGKGGKVLENGCLELVVEDREGMEKIEILSGEVHLKI